jgi:hypothetical protein
MLRDGRGRAETGGFSPNKIINRVFAEVEHALQKLFAEELIKLW